MKNRLENKVIRHGLGNKIKRGIFYGSLLLLTPIWGCNGGGGGDKKEEEKPPVTYTYFQDSDGDGFGNPNEKITTTDSSPPTNYVKNSNDCDDTNPEINPNTKWYKDKDLDLEGDGTFVTQCAASDDYFLASELENIIGDCDDTDPEINSQTKWKLDKDRDGYWNGIDEITQCTASDDYFLGSELNEGVDCDDNNYDINPGREEICFDGIDNNCSGEVDESCELPASWDWRYVENSEGGLENYMTSVKTQEGSKCKLYSFVGAMEAQENITNSTPNTDRNISEKYFSCEGEPVGVVDFAMTYGFPDEECVDDSCGTCSDLESRLHFIENYNLIGDSNWAYLSNEQQIELTKKAIMKGPVVVNTYMSGEFDELGIYRCDGNYEDDKEHSVLIVGWDDTGDINTSSWIAKNSYGENWNEDGYYPIGWNEEYDSGIHTQCRTFRTRPLSVEVDKEE